MTRLLRLGPWRAALLLCLASSCATTPGRVGLRPDGTPGPEECPEEALKAMRYLRIGIGRSALIQLDLNQDMVIPVTLYDGSVESMLEQPLGLLGAGTRLYGQVWTEGPQVTIRYYEAQPIGEEPIPLCAVARMANGQLRKRPDSPPGAAIFNFSRAGIFVVNAFR
ncbi:serine/threonine protein kinase [Cystobacter ferrugineus]|uniref:Serine/threonine protein kinase n=1 Tax=Cystobacter ferrugineus TaxID=83449 RepID=A0A1L9B2T6_9BACT|nr:serine/threonine protein kinase [Cystobacter ferrugineus]OJH36572.1 serine/threonine protein kinase [Cystobacter ferrugineus]